MTDHPSYEHLKRRTVSALEAAAGDTVLAALAAVSPGAAAEWLVEQQATVRAALAPSRLGGLIRPIAEACAATPGLVPRATLVGLIGHYGHLLAAEHAIELAAMIRSEGHDPDLAAALDAALERAPTHAGLLRAAARSVAAAGDHGRAHELLTRLGRSDPRLATLQSIYGIRRTLPRLSLPPVRIALLSSFTIDPLVPFVDLECRSLHLEPHCYVAPFNTWERETLGEGSGLQRFEPHIVFLAVAADDLVPELAAGAAATDVAAAGATAVDRLLAAAARFTAWSSAVIVVHALHSAFPDPLGPAGARAGPGRGEVLAALNRQLADGLRALPRAYMLDVPDALARRRQGALDNPKLRHLARMRFSEPALEEVARAYAQFVAPITGRTRKCVVVDLDNTLWGGIVGEDGPHGIRLGDTSPGSEFREFQQYLLSLSQRGMLLAINSKNNEADALEVIRSHEAMILRETAFSAVRINWDHKSTNMVSIAEELGIGLDALVFIDDSDNERALMRQALPQVLTVEMPRDPARYRETLERLPELQTMTVTTEDRARTQQYAERRQREQLRVAAQSLDEYLGSLGIVVEMAPASERTLPRVHQLFQRTNQFNLTGRRYELGTLASRAGDPAWRVYTTHVSDRFGDHGLVATAVVRLSADAWEIENLVMSCRVIGYGIENALLARLAADARTASARWLIGEFIPTAKNAPARDFFSHSAFVRDGAGAPSERWRRDLVRAAVTPPPWITVKAANGA